VWWSQKSCCRCNNQFSSTHTLTVFGIGSWSHTLLNLVVFLCGLVVVTLFKKSKALSFQILSQWNLAGLFFKYSHRLTEVAFWFDVTLSRWRPWCHLMQISTAVRWVHMQCLPAIRQHFCLQFLIHSTFVLVLFHWPTFTEEVQVRPVLEVNFWELWLFTGLMPSWIYNRALAELKYK